MSKNITSGQRLWAGLAIAVVSLLISYHLPQSIWPFMLTALGFVGLVYIVIIFFIDAVKLVTRRSKA